MLTCKTTKYNHLSTSNDSLFLFQILNVNYLQFSYFVLLVDNIISEVHNKTYKMFLLEELNFRSCIRKEQS